MSELPDKLEEMINNAKYDDMEWLEWYKAIWFTAQKELISEFVEDLGEIRIQYIMKNKLLMIDKVLTKIEKWEERLPDATGKRSEKQ